MFGEKQPKYKYVYRGKPFPYSFYLTDQPTHCSLCDLLGRAESKHSYLTCPVCFEEAREYEKNQELQDFLFGEMPEEQRGYSAEIHGKVRITEVAVAAGLLTRDEGYSLLQDLAQTLQYPFLFAKTQQQPREAARQLAEYHLFS